MRHNSLLMFAGCRIDSINHKATREAPNSPPKDLGWTYLEYHYKCIWTTTKKLIFFSKYVKSLTYI